MTDLPNLEALYREAQSALKRREYERASGLLRQILLIDENYKDASRLLAQTVKLRRRRWYNDPRSWAPVAFVMIVALGFFVVPRVRGFYTVQPSVTAAKSPTATISPTLPATVTASITPNPIPTAIPLVWKRISLGQEFQRDTVTAIAIDPKDSDVLYVGTDNAGIYKSIDGGLSWRPAHNGLAATRIDSLAIDPSNPHTLFAGVLSDGVYKSTDGGEHWQKANIAGGNASISQIIMDPNDSLHLLYLSDLIYETKDGGQTWQAMLSSGCPQDIQNLIFNPVDSLILYASDGGGWSCEAGVYKSNNGGKTWSLVGLKGERVVSGVLKIDSQAGNILYASASLGSGGAIFYGSTNGGETWEQHLVYGCSVMAIHPTDSKTVYCTGGPALIKTVDGGKTWNGIFTNDGADIGPDEIEALLFSRQDPDVLYMGRKGLYTSTNGGTDWAENSNGLGNDPISLILGTVQNTNLYALDSSCAFRTSGYFPNLFHVSSDGGKTWNKIMDKLCSATLDADGVTHYWIMTNPHSGLKTVAAYRTKNGWEDPQRISMADWDVYGIAVDPHRAGILLVTFYNEISREGNIALSADGGSTWESISKVNWTYSDSPLQFFFDHNKGQVIYAVPREGDLYRSEDGGKTWGICGQPSTQSYGYDSPLAIDLTDSSRAYLATQGKGLLISADGCRTWQPSGLNALYVNTIAIEPNSPNTLYAGTDGGAYVSFDGGQSWGQINDGLLGATVVYSLVVDKDSSVYAATPYGIFRLEGK